MRCCGNAAEATSDRALAAFVGDAVGL